MNKIFPRSSVKRQGLIPFRTRGHLSDACLRGLTDCGPRRPEASAQAQVIRHLSFMSPPISDDVEWEVAADGTPPGSPTGAAQADEACAIETRLKPPVDTLLDVEVTTSVNAATCSWRVDIMVDDGSALRLIEVKRWSGQARTNVNAQLTRYVSSVASYASSFNPAVQVKRDTSLNTQKWSRGYRHQDRDFCVWADRVIGPGTEGEGNVYYAERPRTPQAVRDGSDRGMGCGDSGEPGITPKAQDLEVPCLASWQVTVPKSQVGDTDLRFTFGDGPTPEHPKGEETRAVPAGAGSTQLMFKHGYAEGQYMQTATVISRTTGQPAGTAGTSTVTCKKAQAWLNPAEQTVESPVPARWVGSVQPHPTTSTTLSFDPGDGTPAHLRTVPAGDEVVSFLFSHTFSGNWHVSTNCHYPTNWTTRLCYNNRTWGHPDR